jgi:hypothetical protein
LNACNHQSASSLAPSCHHSAAEVHGAAHHRPQEFPDATAYAQTGKYIGQSHDIERTEVLDRSPDIGAYEVENS